MNLDENLDGEIIVQKIEKIICLLKEAGYEPYDQLSGYVKTGSEVYITRHGDARELIKGIDIQHIDNYLKGARWNWAKKRRITSGTFLQ